MKLISLYLQEKYIQLLDQLVREGFYPNRAEAIRLFIKDGLESHGKLKKIT